MGAELPTQLDDPVKRLRAIHASTHSAKALQHALGDDIVLDLADVAPPGLLGAGVGLQVGCVSPTISRRSST